MPIVFRTASGAYVTPNGEPAEAPVDAQAEAQADAPVRC